MMMLIIMVDVKPEADGSTVVCVKSAKEQFLHVFSLPGYYHNDCDHHDENDDCDDDHDDCDDDDDCDDACRQSAWSSSS